MLSYKVFRGDYYYPCGGYDDFVGAFASRDEAYAALNIPKRKPHFTWWHIVFEDEIIESG